MNEYRKYLNFVVGAAASYLYIFAFGALIAITPIRPSSFLLASCAHEPIGKVSTYCRIANTFSIAAYDALHFAVAAILLAIVIGLVQKLLIRIGFPYSFGILVMGFVVGLVALTLWFSHFEFRPSWFYILHWSTQIAVFMGVYFLVAKRILALGSPDKPLQPRHEARG